MTMQPESTSLGDLFCRRIPFKVPKHQRAFDWEQEEIDDFIKDLLVLYNAFAEKKSLYEQSNVTLNRELAKFLDWDKQNFQQRRNKLLKMAKKIFTV